MENKNELAFPLIETNEVNQSTNTGLTKREYAAIMAMQGLLASDAPFSEDAEQCAEAAIKYADELFSQLDKL